MSFFDRLGEVRLKDLNVVIMGLGYIGLQNGALIASKGIKVHGVDINKDVIDIINKGKIHITEPDLEGLVKYVVNKKLFQANDTPVKADVFHLICLQVGCLLELINISTKVFQQ